MAASKPEAEEVSQVNRLLQIEDLAWSKQLEKVVSVVAPYFPVEDFYPYPSST